MIFCDIFLIFAQNSDRCSLYNGIKVAVLRITHNLYFRANIRRIIYTPVHPSFISSPEPSWSQGELIVYPCSGVRRDCRRRRRRQQF